MTDYGDRYQYRHSDVLELVAAAKIVVSDINGFVHGDWDDHPVNWEAVAYLLAGALDPFREVD